MAIPEIRVEELKKRLEAGEDLFLLDVRDEFEYEISNIGGQLIPLAELSRRANELDINRRIVTVCKSVDRQGRSVAGRNRNAATFVGNTAKDIREVAS